MPKSDYTRLDMREASYTITGDGSEHVETHDVTMHVTALIRVDVPANANASYAIEETYKKDANDGEELDSGNLDSDEINYIRVPSWAGTYLRLKFTSDQDLDVEVVSH